MRIKWRGLAIAAAALLFLPSLASAQGASKHFPNDKDGNTVNVSSADSGDMSVVAHHNKCPSLDTGDLALSSSTSGEDVATLTMNALCADAESKGFTCKGFKTVSFTACETGTSDSCCDEPTSEGLAYVDCSSNLCQGGGLKGYKLIRAANSVFFDVEPYSATGPEKITSLQSRTKAGNTIQTDILPFYVLRVDPQGVSGNVTVTIDASGGPFSNTFFADLNNLPNSVADETFHKNIADWINSVISGNPAKVRGVGNSPHESEVPQDLNGFYVRLPVGSITDISLGGQMGQNTVSETMRNPQSAIPTLSEWGLILLIAMLVLSAIWMLQRRRSDAGMTA